MAMALVLAIALSVYAFHGVLDWVNQENEAKARRLEDQRTQTSVADERFQSWNASLHAPPPLLGVGTDVDASADDAQSHAEVDLEAR